MNLQQRECEIATNAGLQLDLNFKIGLQRQLQTFLILQTTLLANVSGCRRLQRSFNVHRTVAPPV